MVQEGAIERDMPAISFARWLTVERAGYGLAALLALGIRLWGLGEVPLGPAEAIQSLPALAAMRGATPDLLGVNPFTTVSPLLHAFQRATFLLFGATDGSARFWSAMLAGLSPLLFYFLRRQLTPGGALAAAFLWALSPLGVWSSRLALGDALVPTFSLALLAVVVWPARGHGWALSLGLVSGLLLLTGSNAYTTLLVGLLSLVWFASEVTDFWADLRGQFRFALAGFGIAVLTGSFFLAEPSGLAAAGALPGRWLAGLLPGAGDYSVVEILLRLLLTEPLVIGFGIAGFISSLRRRDRFGVWVGASVALVVLLALLGRDRHPVDLSLAALGLTMLAGSAIAGLALKAYDRRRERDPWLLVLVSFALLMAAFIAIPSGLNPANTPDWRSLYLAVGIACFIMAVVVWVAYGVWDTWQVVAVSLPFVLLAFGLAWHIGQMVSLSYERGAWRQSAILHEQPATNLADLQKLLKDFGGLTGGGRDAAVNVAWPELVTDPAVPVLRWQLRDFEAATFDAALPSEPARVVITPLLQQGVQEQGLLADYAGQELGVLQRWNTGQLPDLSSILRWVLYREARTAPEKTRAIFWVKW